jgi:glucan biosynthesis protein C
MQSVTDSSQGLASQARPIAVSTPKAVRLSYLDNLRVILISMVILQHTAITYGALGGWVFQDPLYDQFTGILLTIITTLFQSFFMGLFFFISGYFIPRSYDRKGLLWFWKDRLMRLGIPLVLYTWLLNRIPNYFAAVANGAEQRTFWDFTAQSFLSSPEEGPTWFLFALLLFCLGYTLWRLAARFIPAESLAWANRLPVPGIGGILGFGIVIGGLMYATGLFYPINKTVDVFGIFSLMVIFFPQYILMFIAGILAYRNDWLTKLSGKTVRFWAWLSLGLVILVPVMFVVGGAVSGAGDDYMGGLHWQAVMFLLWIGLACVAFSAALTLWLRDRKQPQSRVMAFANPNTFGVYLIHPLILVPLSVGFTYLPIFPLIKFVVVGALTIILSFVLVDGLRRIPGVKAIL